MGIQLDLQMGASDIFLILSLMVSKAMRNKCNDTQREPDQSVRYRRHEAGCSLKSNLYRTPTGGFCA